MHSLLISIILFLSLLNLTATAASIHYPPPPYYNCSSNISNTYSPNSTYQTNLQTLLSWLSFNATSTSKIYSTSISNMNSSNTVYGLFMCRIGDGTPNCQDCVVNSTKLISKLCPLAKEALLWADNCFVRYADRNFFTTVEESPKLTFMNEVDYKGQVGRFNSILWDTLNDVRNRTANVPVGSFLRQLQLVSQ